MTSAAELWCCFTAHLYEEQTSKGVIAVTKACYGLVFQRSTEQCEINYAKTSAGLHFCWLTAHLYEEQISIGAVAVTQVSLFCRALLNSGECILPRPVLHCI